MNNDKTRNYGLNAIAAVVLVGALGTPLGSLLRLGLVAACPLMMFFMMRNMHSPRWAGIHRRHECRLRRPSLTDLRQGPASTMAP
ncbi:DUF2933 domain-containing protein [Streptomyces sp. NPDC006208]|uniref:DUF2933 domain-containing protein n=1 Tax=Streptomyces sp. NPDC006208 TaxID=3156734 RepID=UPI00339FAFB5